MAQPQWITPQGSLGTIVEGVFFSTPVVASDSDNNEVEYALIAGTLPAGIQVSTSGLLAGVPQVQGTPTEVDNDITSEFVLRASSVQADGTTRISDRIFTLTVTGQDIPEFVTPSGSIGIYLDGGQVTRPIEFTDADSSDVVIISKVAGTLPDNVSLAVDGTFTGYIDSLVNYAGVSAIGFDANGFEEDSFDVTSIDNTSLLFQFDARITDSKDYNQSSFNLTVVDRTTYTTDSDDLITVDSTIITVDLLPLRPPIVSNYVKSGDLGTHRIGNFYAHRIELYDFDGDNVELELVSGSLPTGLSLDTSTGWITGTIDDATDTLLNFEFAVKPYKGNYYAAALTATEWTAGVTYSVGNLVSYNNVIYLTLVEHSNTEFKLANGTTAYFETYDYGEGVEYHYSISTIGTVDRGITWVSGEYLADENVHLLETLLNGDTSVLAVKAVADSGTQLSYRLVSGSLPTGLELSSLGTGHIIGRASFNTFSIDGGTTTFDVDRFNREGSTATTSIDLTFDFVVEAYNSIAQISSSATYRIVIDRQYNVPYESLKLRAFPAQSTRDLVNTIVSDSEIIDSDDLFRADDPAFGKNTELAFVQAYGLPAVNLREYVYAMEKNHYRKRLVVGDIKTAKAQDAAGNDLYEVVYAEIVDTQTNKNNQSSNLAKRTAFPVTTSDGRSVTVVYPNSLENMYEQIAKEIGIYSSVLPKWMTTKQDNGEILGFTRAWVIAYTNPGRASKIAYNLRNQYGNMLNSLDFDTDRYEIDRSMSSSWILDDTYELGGYWAQENDSTTINYRANEFDAAGFDEVPFDEQTPVIITDYNATESHNKYIAYPNTNILYNRKTQ